MRENGIGRRTFLKGTALTALSAAGMGPPQEARAQSMVPNSSGTEAAKGEGARKFVRLPSPYL